MIHLKNSFFLVLPFVFSFGNCLAQKDSTKLAYVAPSIGLYLINEPSFKNVYRSNFVSKVSLALAVPITKKFFLKGSFSHMRKNGVPVIYTYDSNFNVIDSRREGKSSFATNIINLGGELRVVSLSKISFSLEGGFSVFKGREDQYYADGSELSSSPFAGLMAFYGGAEIDYKIKTSAVFFNPTYSHSREDLATIDANYGGFSFQSGLKFFF
tara:strand:+ start:24588 stop:25223 length:636 start_codon:yes stop_codon:yes gene_type:complete